MKIPRGQTEERKAYMKAYREINPQNRSEYKAAYDAANKQKNAEYYIATKERQQIQRAEWYKKNREKVLARAKANYIKNKERITAYQSEYYTANLKKVTTRNAAYRKANPEICKNASNRRRVRKANNGGLHTAEERIKKFAELGNVCFYCGKAKKLTIDHDVPLARGGTDNIENILPACRSCNSRKKTRTSQEFIEFMRENHVKTGGIGGTDSR